MAPDRRRRVSPLAWVLFALVPLLLSGPTVSAQAVSGPPLPAVSLGQLRNGDNILSGHVFSATYYFPGPGPFTVGPDNWLDFDFGGSDRLDTGLQGTLYWNNQPLQDFVTTSSTEQRLTVELPQGSVNPDGNRLDVQASAYSTSTSSDCRPVPNLRLTVFDTTQVRYDVANATRIQQTATADLALLPGPFVDPTKLYAPPVHVVVPANPSSGVLSDVSTVVAELGQADAAHAPSIAMQQDTGELSPDFLDNSNVLFVGPISDLPTLGSVPLAAQRDPNGQILGSDGLAIGDDVGVVAESVSPWNNALLVLTATGETEAGVHRAAQTLGNRLGIQSLSGQVSFIPNVVQPTAPSDASPEQTFTLASLGQDDAVVTGTEADHHVSYTFSAGRGDTDMIFNLVASASPLVDPRLSSMRVSIDNSPLTAIDLTGLDSTSGSIPINLPAPLLRPGENTLGLDLTLYRTQSCAGQSDDDASIDVKNTSSFQFGAINPAASGRPTTLASYPYPFLDNGAVGESLIVVPDTGYETRLGQLQASFGGITNTDAVGIPVVRASDLTDAQRAGSDLILMGLPSDNATLAQINDTLPLQVDGQQRTVHSPTLSLAVTDTSPLGVLNVLPSPWSSGRTILILTGTEPDGVDLALAALSQGNLDGNAALVSAANPQSRLAGTLATPVPLDLGFVIPQRLQITTYGVPSGPSPSGGAAGVPTS